MWYLSRRRRGPLLLHFGPAISENLLKKRYHHYLYGRLVDAGCLWDHTTHGPPKPDDELTKLIAREWRQVYPCSQGVPLSWGKKPLQKSTHQNHQRTLRKLNLQELPALDEDMVIQSIGITAPNNTKGGLGAELGMYSL